ncbi:septum formation initiator family protein [Irregularibacter muris]|uniref:Septum formation initiator family protein n=1 Tax=Irregularibacter muris TaxID=1796619 RepID=A0AAE3L2Q5_9FIRM|nr:septum formation initiator family protein [Irregularibacter muris]MCR1899039.1 septum formation initiator family protein [Irregularibacter muris]
MDSRNREDLVKRYQRKKKKRSRRRTIFLLLIIFGYFLYQYIHLEIRYQNLAKEKEQLSIEVEKAQKYYQQLAEEIEQSKSDKHIEIMARKYFGLVYPNEKVYIEVEKDTQENKK